MTKYYRRVGTTAFRFCIEVQIQKVELKVPKPSPYPQRLSVIFKRGELRKETTNAPLMEDGVAYFNEKLTVPGILYFDNRKKQFMQKEATLAVNLISKRSTKLMGVTKFDLSTFVNNNVQEKDIVLKMEKCNDKNAKFYFKLNITQVKELGSTRKSMKVSGSFRSGSLRSSMKEVNASVWKESIKQSFKDSLKNIEEEKESNKKNNDEMDELFSYYTDSNECSPRRSLVNAEPEEKNLESLGSPHHIAFPQRQSSPNDHDICNVSILDDNSERKSFASAAPEERTFNFNLFEPAMPQLCQSPEIPTYRSKTKSFLRKDSVSELEQKLLSYEKELENTAVLKQDFEKLQRAYDVLSKNQEHPKIRGFDIEDKENIPGVANSYQTKNYDLERKLKQLEDQNDLLTKRVQELENSNQNYLTKIEKYIEKENSIEEIVPPVITHQNDKKLEEVIKTLKGYKQIKQQDIENFERTVNELHDKLSQSEQTVERLKETQRSEKEKHLKEIELLEQGIQRLIREHEQQQNKGRVKGGHMASYDTGVYHSQTMSSNSLITREESILEEPSSLRGILCDSGEHTSRDLKGSPSAKTMTDIPMLKQEINYLNAKLFAITNLQKQYEEQVKQRHILQQENKVLKTDLEKANKGWAYAEEERYELAKKIQEFVETPDADLIEQNNTLEMEVFKLKAKLGEVMNVALELGGAELLDKIESIMVPHQDSRFPSVYKRLTFGV